MLHAEMDAARIMSAPHRRAQTVNAIIAISTWHRCAAAAGCRCLLWATLQSKFPSNPAVQRSAAQCSAVQRIAAQCPLFTASPTQPRLRSSFAYASCARAPWAAVGSRAGKYSSGGAILPPRQYAAPIDCAAVCATVRAIGALSSAAAAHKHTVWTVQCLSKGIPLAFLSPIAVALERCAWLRTGRAWPELAFVPCMCRVLPATPLRMRGSFTVSERPCSDFVVEAGLRTTFGIGPSERPRYPPSVIVPHGIFPERYRPWRHERKVSAQPSLARSLGVSESAEMPWRTSPECRAVPRHPNRSDPAVCDAIRAESGQSGRTADWLPFCFAVSARCV